MKNLIAYIAYSAQDYYLMGNPQLRYFRVILNNNLIQQQPPQQPLQHPQHPQQPPQQPPQLQLQLQLQQPLQQEHTFITQLD